MGILKYSYVDKFMFTGLWSGQTFSNLLKVTTLHWAPVSISYETGIPFEGGVTDQSKFSFLIWLIYVEFWILTVSIKIHNRSGQRVHLIRFFQRYVLWDQHVGSKLWNGSFLLKHDKLFQRFTFASGMWTIAKFTFFYEVLSVLVSSVMARLLEFF